MDSFDNLRFALLEHYSSDIWTGLRTAFGGPIHLIDLPLSDDLKLRFMKSIHEHYDCKISLGLHGSNEKNFESIREHGLLIPGNGNTISVAHGSAYGNGIYIANLNAAWLSQRFCSAPKIHICAVIESAQVRYGGPDARVVFEASHVVPLFVAQSARFIRWNDLPSRIVSFSKLPCPPSTTIKSLFSRRQWGAVFIDIMLRAQNKSVNSLLAPNFITSDVLATRVQSVWHRTCQMFALVSCTESFLGMDGWKPIYGYLGSDLLKAGIQVAKLKKKGFEAAALRKAGYTAPQLKEAGFSITSMRDAGFKAASMREAGFEADALRNVGYAANELKHAGFSVTSVRDAGYPDSDLLRARFGAASLKKMGFKAAALRSAGFQARQLKQAGFSLSSMKKAGFEASDLRRAGFKAVNLKEVGFEADALKIAKYKAGELKNAGFSIASMRDAGFTATELRDGGFTAAALKQADYSFSQVQEGGFCARELRKGNCQAKASQLGRVGFDRQLLLFLLLLFYLLLRMAEWQGLVHISHLLNGI